jgi:hypothetical protein
MSRQRAAKAHPLADRQPELAQILLGQLAKMDRG